MSIISSLRSLFSGKPAISVDVDLNRVNRDDLIDAAYNLEFIAKELRKMAGEVV